MAGSDTFTWGGTPQEVDPNVSLEPAAVAPSATPAAPTTGKGSDTFTWGGIEQPAVEKELPASAQGPQFDISGKPRPGSLAAELKAKPHPLTVAALQTVELTRDIDSNQAAIKKVIKSVYGDTINGKVIDELTPEYLQDLIKLPTIVKALNKDTITRKKLALDAEMAAILKGDIPTVLAAEGHLAALQRIGISKLYPEQMTVEAIEARQLVEQGGFYGAIEALANSVKRGPSNAWGGLMQRISEGKYRVAVAAGKTPLDAFIDQFKETAFDDLSLIPGLNPIDWVRGLGAGLGIVLDVNRAGGFSAENAARLQADALKGMEEAFTYFKKVRATLPMSPAATEFMQKFDKLPNNWADATVGMIELIAEDPLAFVQTSTEVLGEQSLILAGSAALTAAAGPQAGITLATLGAYTQERFNADEKAKALIKTKFGYDMETQAGLTAYMKDPAAVDAYNRALILRGLTIAGGNAVGFRMLQKLPYKSAALNFVHATGSQSFVEGSAEYIAGLVSTGKGDPKEAIAETAFGMNPGQIALDATIAGVSDFRQGQAVEAAKQWLRTGEAVRDEIAGVDVNKLNSVAEILGARLELNGSPDVFIDAGALLQFDQDGNVSETLGLDPVDVRRAAAEGDRVQVSAETYIRHIVGSDGFTQLLQHTTDDAAGLTANEAEQYTQEDIEGQITETLAKRVLGRLSPSIDDQSLEKLSNDVVTIQDAVAAQLQSTGVYDAERSQVMALLTAQRYATRAVRLTEETGRPVDALNLYLQDNLQITGRAEAPPVVTLEQAQKGFVDERIPQLEEAARQRSAGEITQEQYQAVVDEFKPVLPYESVPEPATVEEMQGALQARQLHRLGKGQEFIGQEVGIRLDIPAYSNHGVWVPTVHNIKGPPVAHEAATQITNAVFTQPGASEVEKAARVGRGEVTKTPFAKIDGILQSVDPAELKTLAEQAINDPAWTQVGYDPRRHTFFYDRKTQQPVLAADEVIQVGPLVLAKNAQFGEAEAFLYQAANEQLDAALDLDEAKSDVVARIESANGEVLEFTQVDGFVDLAQVPILTLQDLEGMRIFPTVADRTAAAVLYTGIEGAELDVAIPLLGGPFFPLRASNWLNNVVWADRGASVAGAKETKVTEGGATHMMVVLGDPNMHISNTTVTTAYFKTLLAALQNPANKFDANAAKSFTEFMQTWEGSKLIEPQKENFPNDDAYNKAKKNYRENVAIKNGVNGFPGFDNPAAIIDHLHTISFEARKKIMQIAGSKKVTAITGVNMQKLLNATREQSLSGAGWGDGVLLIELDTENTFVELGQGETTKHPDFPLGMRGKVAGRFETPIAWQVLWQDYVEAKAGTDNVRRAFELARPIVEVTPELLAKINELGSIASPGIETRAHASMVSDAVSKRWARGGVAVKDGGLGAAEFLDAMDIATDGLINKLRDQATGKEGLNAAIKAGDVFIAKLGSHHVYYGVEKLGDDLQLSALVNNDSGTYGIGETLAILDALDNGVTTAVADPASNIYTLLRDLGFDPHNGVLRWTGDSNAKGSLLERYIGGRLADVLGSRAAEDGRAIASSSRAQAEVDAGGRDQVRPEDIERDPSVTRADSATSRARAIADRISKLSPRARENLGLTEQDQANINALTQKPLALEQQPLDAGPRGGFTPADRITDQDGNPVNLIQIFEKADVSTFLHESGHFWLEQLKGDAAAVGGQFGRDWDIVRNWWGSRPLELREEAVRRAKKAKDKDAVAALQKMSEAQVAAYARAGDLRGEGTMRYLSVAMHEQFARGVENYFATGRAPSLSLAGAFNAFKVWVLSVYTKLFGARLDVQFSPEVTQVMDRMLAADEEIALVEGQYELAALFDSAEQAGLTPSQFADYQKQLAETRIDRRAKHLAKHIKELKRARTKWWNAEREKLRAEVTAEIADQREHKLVFGLTAEGADRMDRATLVELLKEQGIDITALPRVGNRAIYEADGVSPAAIALEYGYADVNEMIEALGDYIPLNDAVEARLDDRMEAEHGSIETSGETEALHSAYSDKTARVLAAELEALRTTEPAFKQQFVRAYARNKILDLPSEQVRPHRFLLAERRHAKLAAKALKKGDRVEAYRQQFQRLVSHYMAREAIRAQRDVEKKFRYMRTFTKRGAKFPAIEASYVDNILRILAAVNLDVGPQRQRGRSLETIALQEFITAKQAEDGSLLDVPAWLLDTAAERDVRKMKYLHFLELHETVQRYEKQGRAAKKIRIGDAEVDRELAKAELLAALGGRNRALVNRLRDKGATTSEAGFGYTPASILASTDAQLLKIENLLEALDGKPLGVWHQTIYEPFNKAAADKYVLQEEVSRVIGQLIADLPRDVRRNFGKRVDVGRLGRPGLKMTRGSLIMLALNVGNASNLDKLIRGMGGDPETNVKGAGWNINEQLIDEALQQLTREEWALVEGVWRHAEKLYPAVEEIYRAEHGVSPDRVEPRIVSTPYGDIQGGYFPMMYDRTIAGVAADLNQKTALELMQAETGRASVNSSMTKARTGYAAPVDLDISRLALGMDNTIHFITHYGAVRNANKILGDRTIRAELEDKVGIAYTDQLLKWVAALASNGNDSPPVDIIQKLLVHLQSNTTIAVLGFSYSTLGMQTLGLINGVDRIAADTTYGPITLAEVQKDIAVGVASAARPDHVRFVQEVSVEMRARRQNMDREVATALRRLTGKEGMYARGQRFAMEAIAHVQFYTVDLPVWTAAYNRALRGDPSDTATAVKYADRVVRMSQSAGGLKDLAAVQRHKGIMRGLTMFYSWFSAFYAVMRQLGVQFSENVRRNPAAATTRAATRLFVLLALSSLGAGAIKGDLPDLEPEDEDEKGLLRYVAEQSAVTALGVFPIIRDLAQGLVSGFGYRGGIGATAFEAAEKSLSGIVKVIDEYGDEVTDEATNEEIANQVKPFILLAGALFGLPAVQLNRFMDGYAAMLDDAENWNWTDLVRGYSEKRAAARD